MPRSPHPLPGALGGVFTAAEARQFGVSARRLGAPDVVRLARGVYARVAAYPPDGQTDESPAEIWQRRQRRLAVLIAPTLPTGLFFTGRTAAALWRLPVPMPPLHGRPCAASPNAALDIGGIDIACNSARSGRLSPGLDLTRVSPDHVRVVSRFGVRLTDPASTWAVLAPKLGRDDGVALGDAVIREARIPGTARLERPPHAVLADLEALAAVRYRAGRRALNECLPLLSPHAASAPESHLRLRFADWKLPRPELDYDVYSPGGLLLGCSEIAYPEFRLAFEYEGDHHRTDRHQWNRDIEKIDDYASAGWEVFRVTGDALYRRTHELRARALRKLRTCGWSA